MKKALFGRFILAAVFIGSNVSFTLAQNQKLIDSLKSELLVAKDIKRFDLLNAIAWECRFAYPDSTIYYANKAYELGRQMGVTKTLATSLNYLGVAYNYNGDRVKAIEYHLKAIEIAALQNDSSSIAHANNSIGRVYFEQGMIQRSVEYYFKAQKIFENIHDLSGIAYVDQSMGNLYRSQGDFVNAINYYKKALITREKLGNKRDLIGANVLLGRGYQDSNALEKSNEFFFKAIAIGKQINDAVQIAEIEMFLSQNFLKSRKLTEAESYAISAYKTLNKIYNIRLLPQSNIILGQIYLEGSKLEKASHCFHEALTVAIKINDAAAQRDAYFWLWKLAKEENQESAAMSYQNKFLIMRDSTSSLELSREVDRLLFQLEMEKRDNENAMLKSIELRNDALIKQQRLENAILIIVGVMGIGLVILLGVYNRRRIKLYEKLALKNNQISLRNQQLSDLNNEKDTLMNIMVHDLKAPLNNIKGLTSLIELDGEVNANQSYYLKLIKDSTQSGLEMITDLLDAHSIETEGGLSIEEIDLQDFLTHRVNTFMKTALEKSVTIELHAQEILVNSDKGYLARILDNLISNAIKFSPPSTNVSLKASEVNGAVKLSVKDQGQGFTDSDKKDLFKKFKKLSARPTAGESSNGLGLAIVKILVDRLGGGIELISKRGEGSEFIITIPNVVHP